MSRDWKEKSRASRNKNEEYFKPLEVHLRNGENIDRMIKRFLKKVRNDGVLQEYNSRRHHVKKSQKKRRNRIVSSWNLQNDTRN